MKKAYYEASFKASVVPGIVVVHFERDADLKGVTRGWNKEYRPVIFLLRKFLQLDGQAALFIVLYWYCSQIAVVKDLGHNSSRGGFPDKPCVDIILHINHCYVVSVVG